MTVSHKDLDLPNVRSMFKPDPGFIWLDCDLSGADAQVVAWEAGDEELKKAFKLGLKVHKKNAEDMWGEEFTKLDPSGGQYAKKYHDIKQAVHSTNYHVSAKSLAGILGWRIREAEEFQRRWFGLHPALLEWHRRVERELQTRRAVTNAFGFTRTYFDRVDGLLPEALAWVPQSTVGIVCSKGIIQVRKSCPWVQFLLQVHDSANFQIPETHIHRVGEIKSALLVVVPYDDPLTIDWSVKYSRDSWGACASNDNDNLMKAWRAA